MLYLQHTLSSLGIQQPSQPPSATTTSNHRQIPQDHTTRTGQIHTAATTTKDETHPSHNTVIPSISHQNTVPITMVTSHTGAIPSTHVPVNSAPSNARLHHQGVAQSGVTTHHSSVGMTTAYPDAIAMSHPVTMATSSHGTRTASHPMTTAYPFSTSNPHPNVTPTSRPMPQKTGPDHSNSETVTAAMDRRPAGSQNHQEIGECLKP